MSGKSPLISDLPDLQNEKDYEGKESSSAR